MVSGEEDVIYGNVMNHGYVPDLPTNSCVEVPCVTSLGKLTPQSVPALPLHLNRLIQTNISVQQLTVEALLTGKKEPIYHAAMLDPHTAAELSLDQIWHMVDDLLEAHQGWIPEFK